MTPRRFGAATGTVLLLAVAGCASAAAPTALPAGAGATASGTPDRLAACAGLVSFWVAQAVTPGGDQGLDYQEMGLSEGEYDIVRALLPTARALAARRGTAAVGPAVTSWAVPRCRAYLAGGTASAQPGDGWPQ